MSYDTCTCGHPAMRHHVPTGRCLVMEPPSRTHVIRAPEIHDGMPLAMRLELGDRRWIDRGGMNQCACGGFEAQAGS